MVQGKWTRLVVVLVALVLVAAMATTAGAQSRVRLTVWGRDLPADDPAHSYFRVVVPKFQAKNPDIALEYIALGDPGIQDKVSMATNTDLPGFRPGIARPWAASGRRLWTTEELESIPTTFKRPCVEGEDLARAVLRHRGRT